MGAGARAHPWGGVSAFKMHYSITFKHQSNIGRPPLGEILYPPLQIGNDFPISVFAMVRGIDYYNQMSGDLHGAEVDFRRKMFDLS